MLQEVNRIVSAQLREDRIGSYHRPKVMEKEVGGETKGSLGDLKSREKNNGATEKGE